jgi:hypothetical protein
LLDLHACAGHEAGAVDVDRCQPGVREVLRGCSRDLFVTGARESSGGRDDGHDGADHDERPD